MSLIKFNLLKQIKTHKFLFIVMISILLGVLFVPGLDDGYEVFSMGGVRGIYNSAWIGAISGMLTSVFLWLPGFYLQRSQITEDKELRIGQIIASTPISKFRYIFGKFVSNLVVLLALNGFFLLSMIGMQLFRHESLSIQIWQYIGPQIVLVIPSLIFCASLTVLLDVLPGLKGAMGNCAMFFLWTFLTVASIEMPGTAFDVFGLGFVLDEMQKGASAFYPHIPEGGSFTYNRLEGPLKTFQWEGMDWSSEIIVSRLVVIGISLGLVVLTALIFNRFRETSKANQPFMPQKDKNDLAPMYVPKSFNLSDIKIWKNINFFGLVKGELKLLLNGRPFWWYALVLTGLGISIFAPLGEGTKWISIILLLPMSLWSQMSTRDKLYGTEQLLNSSCSKSERWLATWVAGLIISLLMSSGILIRFAIMAQWSNLAAWAVGIVFIPTLAMTLGSLSKSRRLFEAIFIVLFYFGAIQGMGVFDFLGISYNNTVLYTVLTIVIFAIGYFYQELKVRS